MTFCYYYHQWFNCSADQNVKANLLSSLSSQYYIIELSLSVLIGILVITISFYSLTTLHAYLLLHLPPTIDSFINSSAHLPPPPPFLLTSILPAHHHLHQAKEINLQNMTKKQMEDSNRVRLAVPKHAVGGSQHAKGTVFMQLLPSTISRFSSLLHCVVEVFLWQVVRYGMKHL